MNYPFLYQRIGEINVEDLKNSIKYSGETNLIWDDWQLHAIESSPVRDFLKHKYPHLKLFKDSIYISEGIQCNFHIDRFHVYHLLHRILIPLHDNYKYEWVINEQTISYVPKTGEVLLFNNMVPHRFKSLTNEKREVIYLDVYDPLVENILSELKGNYSSINAILEKKYP